jgi:hypothetical protein
MSDLPKPIDDEIRNLLFNNMTKSQTEETEKREFAKKLRSKGHKCVKTIECYHNPRWGLTSFGYALHSFDGTI